MKSLLFTLFVLISLFGQAQMKQGAITYSLVYSSDNPDMQAALGMMDNSSMTTYFMPKLSRVDMTIGFYMDMKTVTNIKKKKAVLLMTIMDKNVAVQGTIAEFEEFNNKNSAQKEVTLMEETKLVFGYMCKRAMINTSDGKSVEVWYTEEIKADIQGQQYYDSRIPGFPMQITSTENGMTVVFTVTEISEEVSKSDFDMKIPDGYEKKKPKDLEEGL